GQQPSKQSSRSSGQPPSNKPRPIRTIEAENINHDVKELRKARLRKSQEEEERIARVKQATKRRNSPEIKIDEESTMSEKKSE
ncbi:hypothetical protein PMAYCL1PPCAC_00179, partial [Pristionchus mayeri]